MTSMKKDCTEATAAFKGFGRTNVAAILDVTDAASINQAIEMSRIWWGRHSEVNENTGINTSKSIADPASKIGINYIIF
jgi:hypothetical protein